MSHNYLKADKGINERLLKEFVQIYLNLYLWFTLNYWILYFKVWLRGVYNKGEPV